MPGQHQGDSRARRTRAMITTMFDAPTQTVVNTFFADMPVPIKVCVGAHETKVVKCLNDGNAVFATDAVNGRGNYHKCIVNVYQVRPFSCENLIELLMCIPGPHCTLSHGKASKKRHLANLEL